MAALRFCWRSSAPELQALVIQRNSFFELPHMNPSNISASKLATRLAFWVAGFGLSAWAPLVPYAKGRLQIDDRTLGLLLLCLGIGSVAAMVRTGPLCARYGCKPVIVTGGLCMALLLPLLSIADSKWLMAIALALFGGALGSLDVAMNVHAIEVERNVGRPMMSGFHALFSVGGFCGAAFVAAMLSHSISPTTATLVCAALMVVAMALTAPRLLATPTTTAGQSGALMALPKGPVVILSVLAAITFLVEGALLDWSALLLTDMNLSTPERAGVGYAMFSVAMTAGRFSGDAITARFGDNSVVFWGGLAVLVGFTSLLTMNNYVMAMVGFILIGLGASNVVPVLFRQAGAQNAMPIAMAIAAVTTIGYAGQLLGPAAMGFVSKLAGLQAAFWMLAALMCLVPVFAHTASNSHRTYTKANAT